MKDKLKIILCSVLLVILLVLLYFNNFSNLELFKNSNLDDSDKIENIINILEYGNDVIKLEINDDSLIIDYDLEFYNYKTLEKNASILFYLVDDLNTIKYNILEDEYIFEYDQLEKIYGDFDSIKVSDINKRYDSDNFSKLYLGNINGSIDIFDVSELCLEKYVEIYRNNSYVYYITCSSVDDILVVEKNNEYKLMEALDKSIISVEDLFATNVKIKKEELVK